MFVHMDLRRMAYGFEASLGVAATPALAWHGVGGQSASRNSMTIPIV